VRSNRRDGGVPRPGRRLLPRRHAATGVVRARVVAPAAPSNASSATSSALVDPRNLAGGGHGKSRPATAAPSSVVPRLRRRRGTRVALDGFHDATHEDLGQRQCRPPAARGATHRSVAGGSRRRRRAGVRERPHRPRRPRRHHLRRCAGGQLPGRPPSSRRRPRRHLWFRRSDARRGGRHRGGVRAGGDGARRAPATRRRRRLQRVGRPLRRPHAVGGEARTTPRTRYRRRSCRPSGRSTASTDSPASPPGCTASSSTRL
jgi:hypothetical protein